MFIPKRRLDVWWVEYDWWRHKRPFPLKRLKSIQIIDIRNISFLVSNVFGITYKRRLEVWCHHWWEEYDWWRHRRPFPPLIQLSCLEKWSEYNRNMMCYYDHIFTASKTIKHIQAPWGLTKVKLKFENYQLTYKWLSPFFTVWDHDQTYSSTAILMTVRPWDLTKVELKFENYQMT